MILYCVKICCTKMLAARLSLRTHMNSRDLLLWKKCSRVTKFEHCHDFLGYLVWKRLLPFYGLPITKAQGARWLMQNLDSGVLERLGQTLHYFILLLYIYTYIHIYTYTWKLLLNICIYMYISRETERDIHIYILKLYIKVRKRRTAGGRIWNVTTGQQHILRDFEL